MYELKDRPDGGCCFPVTEVAETSVALCADMPFAKHLFCGAPAQEGSSYCPEHHARCYCGEGKDIEALVSMIHAVERTVVHMPANLRLSGRETTAPLDRPEHARPSVAYSVDIALKRRRPPV